MATPFDLAPDDLPGPALKLVDQVSSTPDPGPVDVTGPAIEQLPEGEARYARAARAANTLRG